MPYVSPGSAFFFAGRVLGLRIPGHTNADDQRAAAVSRRYLRGAALGVALSLVPLVVVLFVADGMIQGITSRYIETGTYHLQARALVGMDQTALDVSATALRSLPGIRAFGELQGAGIAIAGSRTAGVMVRAVDPAFLEDAGTVAYLTLGEGKLRLDSANQIILGEPLAKDLGVKVGQTISLLTQKPGNGNEKTTMAFVPKISVFRVQGIVSAGYRELDALWAFISLRAGTRILWDGGARSIIGIKIDKPFSDLEAARRQIGSALSSDWSIVTWPEAESNVYKSFATTRMLLLLVMALAVAVAALNVSSALIMLVLERRRDIAIIKSAGASPSMVGRIFVSAGLTIGGIGTFLGIGAGSLIAWRINDLVSALQEVVNALSRLWANISGTPPPRSAIHLLDPSYYLERIPVNIHFSELAAVAGASLLLCFLASMLPAGRASRLSPLEIFRKT